MRACESRSDVVTVFLNWFVRRRDYTSVMGNPRALRSVVFPQRVMLGYFDIEPERGDLWLDIPAEAKESLQYSLSSLNTNITNLPYDQVRACK